MTKTKEKRPTVGDCEETLRALEAKREQLIARGNGRQEAVRSGSAMSALPPKADIGTGTCITFDAAAPAA